MTAAPPRVRSLAIEFNGEIVFFWRETIFAVFDNFISLRAIHFSPLPCSDLGQGVAISTTAFMLPRFFVQTHIFSVSPSSFSLQQR